MVFYKYLTKDNDLMGYGKLWKILLTLPRINEG